MNYSETATDKQGLAGLASAQSQAASAEQSNQASIVSQEAGHASKFLNSIDGIMQARVAMMQSFAQSVRTA